jgi:energy-coupling factor transporter ATP-binding protein EcfA2
VEDSSTKIALNKETLEDLTRLTKVTNQSVQEPEKEFVQEEIEHEKDMALLQLAIQPDVSVAKLIRHEDVNWG